MSRRKFRAPRHGSLRFISHKKTHKKRGHVNFHPIVDSTQPLHLSSFLGYKAGCTHVIREITRPGSPLNQREVSETVTVLETTPMVCVGYVAYRETPMGRRAIYTHHIDSLSDAYVRAVEPKITKHAGLPRAFSTAIAKAQQGETPANEPLFDEEGSPRFDLVRVILHTIPPSSVEQKKAHVIESQVCGGETLEARLEFAKGLLGQTVPVSAFVAANEAIDICGVTKGKGYQGVVKRFGVRILTKKSRKGHRRVGCIGPWHPANVSYSVARPGQMGKVHRTEVNKLVLAMGKAENECAEGNASTPFDPTPKSITPLGGFKNYGVVRGDFLLVKGSVAGPSKACVALRKSVNDPYKRAQVEEGRLKFIDTASKVGKGRFQTLKEKNEFFGRVGKVVE